MSTLVSGQDAFIRVSGRQFLRNGQPYYFMGTNFWYGINLAASGAAGDRDRLIRELDRLQEMGVSNLRIVAGSEGPDSEPWRMSPALQPEKGRYNPNLLDGLDFLLSEMGKRGMYAVVCLNNFWPWSGGMAQYLVWETGGRIPYPPPAEGGDWGTYQEFTTGFYRNEAAMEAFDAHIRLLIGRQNPYTGRTYRDEPAIMAWELANEPRAVQEYEAYAAWIGRCASLIKTLDPNHLVTIGSEGRTSTKYAGTQFKKDHKIPGIDYSTIHIWVQNWEWFDPNRAQETYEDAVKKAIKYLKWHLKQSEALDMPMVLEEFGIGRDLDSYDPAAGTRVRDGYYEIMFSEVHRLAAAGRGVAGVNFWAWGGEGRPRAPKAVWQPGDDFTGDPPHEYQGWYSIYDRDASTIEVIRRYAQLLSALPAR
ncbi:MAG: cellulase family glycosylhydrolase [Bacteroidia bacterium]|nr:cellulase family glycosylhydrolase [Bacteroidia bacterium]